MIIYTLKKTTSAVLLLGVLSLVVAGCGTGDGDIVNDIDECSIHSHTMSQRANEEIDETLHHTPAEYTVRLLVGEQDIDFVADTGSSNLIVQGDENLCENCTGPENEMKTIRAKYRRRKWLFFQRCRWCCATGTARMLPLI